MARALCFYPPLMGSCLSDWPAQDAEAYEAKRSRGGRGGGGDPAWASSRAAAKRSAEEQQLPPQGELDDDDAFAVSDVCWCLCCWEAG